MTTTPDKILSETEASMKKAIDYLQHELRGIRTGRASTALVEYVKVDYYGSPTDLKSLAAISVPEPHQILVKPFDNSAIGAMKQGIESAGLGLNPQIEDKAIRITIPPLDQDRRKQLVSQVKKHGEEQKVVLRNVRRDANKHADALAKQEGTHYPEDEIKTLKEEIQDLLKKYESEIESLVKKKSEEVMEV
ncbi:MAG TPA: ribosome recycling factor [Phycisphaerales bacterium]|nr:ribosome recycling factor [Phycisphaerales bacterium]